MAIGVAFQPLLRVWRYREYALFMGGMAPSLVTLWMQRVGVGWLAWELTHSPAWLGAVAAADLAPMIVLAPFAGALTDRGNPLRQARVTQLLFVLQAIAMAAFTLADAMTIEILFGLSLVSGCLQPLASTARHAIVPATVPRDAFATAIATDSALFNGSRFLGPALAGLMIPYAGVGGTFVVHAVGCAVFSTTLHMMRLAPPDRGNRARGNILGDVVESFSYIARHPGIGPLFLMLTAVSICLRPLQDMLPGFAGSVFDAGAVGLAWLTSAMGVGAMLSALWIAMRGHIAGLTRTVLRGCLALSVSVFGFVATDVLWVSIVFSALAGYAFNSMTTGTQTLVQSSVANELRGRIMGTYTLIYRGTPAFGALAVGALAETIGLRITLAIAAAVTLGAWALTAPRRHAITAAVEAK
ncbi:MAG: MFS transporter [Gemmatimonas sp.]